MRPKNVFLCLGLIFGLCACSSTEYDQLKQTSLLEFLPDHAESIILLPSHQATGRELFTILGFFFEQEALTELKTKLFRNLENEIGLNLLSPGSLDKNGLAINQSLALASLGNQRFYLSLPINNPQLAAKFSSGFAGSFSNFQACLWARNDSFNCVISHNRLYILSGGASATTNHSSWTNLESMIKDPPKGLIAKISVDNSFLKKNFPPIYVTPGRSLLSLSRAEDRVSLELEGQSIALDLLTPFRASLPIALPTAWAQGGYGINGFFALNDLAGVSLVLNLNSIWQTSLRPFLLDQVKRSTRGLDSPLTKLLSGGKPLDEWVMGMIDIENSILARLTGRVGLVLKDLKNFSILAISPSRLQKALDGAIVFETHNQAQAEAIIQHLTSLTILPTGNQLKISQINESGQVLISFSAPRYRMPDIYLVAAGRLILVGIDKASLISLAAQGEYRGGIELGFGKPIFERLGKEPHDASLTLSPRALFTALTKSLDQGTRRNIEPFSDQIKKIIRLSFVQFRQGSKTSLLVDALLSAKPVAYDPFSDSDQDGDPLLIILGSILLAVFLGPLVYKIIRGKRH